MLPISIGILDLEAYVPNVSGDHAASNELISGSSGFNAFGLGFHLAWLDGDFHRIFHCARICGVKY